MLDPGHAASERVLLARRQLDIERLDRMRAQRLGHAERCGPPAAVAHPQVRRQQLVEAAAPDGGQVALSEGRVLHQGLGCVGPADHVGRSAAFDQLQGRPRLEPPLEHDSGAHVHGADERVGQPAHPEQWHRGVEHVGGDQVPELQQVEGMADHGGVGVDHPLGLGCAARGIDNDHRILGLHGAGGGFEIRIADLAGAGEQVVHRPGPIVRPGCLTSGCRRCLPPGRISPYPRTRSTVSSGRS